MVGGGGGGGWLVPLAGGKELPSNARSKFLRIKYCTGAKKQTHLLYDAAL